MVRLIERIRAYKEVPRSYAQRVRTDFDSILGRPYVDVRTILVARLLALNSRKAVRVWLMDKKKRLARANISDYDRRLLSRLLP